MELTKGISKWIDQNFFPNEQWAEDIPAAPGPSLISSILSAAETTKRIIKRNVSDLVTDTENALSKTAANINDEFLTKEKLQDPGQWLGGGSGKAASAFAAAFRPSNSKLLPSTITGLRKQLDYTSQNNPSPAPLAGKLSDKELSKYGTPEFILDKYLPSTKEGGNPKWLGARELPLSTFIQSAAMEDLASAARIQAIIAKETTHPDAMKGAQINVQRLANGADLLDRIPLEPDIRAFRDQITTKEPIFTAAVRSTHLPGASDIGAALKQIHSLAQQSKFTSEQLDKKSLAQLLGIAKDVEKEANKSKEVIADFTKQRTAQLSQEQGLMPGFVELKSKADFGAETEFLKHCVGAGGADQATGDFLPKWHPITGETLIQNGKFNNSAEIYYGLAEKGKAKYISYRPEGIPVATAEIDKFGNVSQLYGFKNSKVPDDVKAKFDEALKPVIRKMKFGDAKYIPATIKRIDPELDLGMLLMNGRPGAVYEARAAFDRMAREWDVID